MLTHKIQLLMHFILYTKSSLEVYRLFVFILIGDIC